MSPDRTAAPMLKSYESDGFCLLGPLIGADLLSDAVDAMEDVRLGRYATGREPVWRVWNPGDDPSRLCKVDQAHWCDERIMRLVTNPGIGRVAAMLTGASMVQVWAVQLIHKPPGTSTLHNIGWHQDDNYWRAWWDGECLTCWLAVSDVTIASGPMRFVRGSHKWGFVDGGNFYDGDMDRIRAGLELPPDARWEEVPAVLAPGAVSFHHRRTIHGSGSNTSSDVRRSFAIHLRTEHSAPLESAPDFVQLVSDTSLSPVIYAS